MSAGRRGGPAGRAATARARLLLYRVWIAVGAIAIASTALNVMGVLAPVILFLAVGSLVAFAAAPIVNALEHLGVPRGAGALAGVLVVVLALACLVVVVVPLFAAQLLEVLVRLPDQLRDLGSWLVGASRRLSALSTSSSGFALQLDSALGSLADLAARFGTDLATNLGRGIVPFISGFASGLFVVFLGLVLAYWLALDYPRIHREIGVILGEEKEEGYRLVIAVISNSVGGYMRGMVITSVVNGALAWIGLAAMGHPYAALMGVLTGILHLVPVIGPVVSAAVAALLALFSSPVLAVWTLVWAMVAQNLTDNVVSPKIMQSSVQVHPAMSLTALVIGSALMGPLGMVVAIPLSAALKGVFVFYFETDTGRQLVSYRGAIFRGTPFRDEAGEPVPAFDALGNDRFVTESELIDEGTAPKASAVPRPEGPGLDNPWARIAGLDQVAGSLSRRAGRSGADDGAGPGGAARPSGDGPAAEDGAVGPVADDDPRPGADGEGGSAAG